MEEEEEEKKESKKMGVDGWEQRKFASYSTNKDKKAAERERERDSVRTSGIEKAYLSINTECQHALTQLSTQL